MFIQALWYCREVGAPKLALLSEGLFLILGEFAV